MPGDPPNGFGGLGFRAWDGGLPSAWAEGMVYGSFRKLGVPLKGSFKGSLKGSIRVL